MNNLSIEELKELRDHCINSTVWPVILDELIAIRELKGDQVPMAWFTDDKEVDKSATTYSKDVARRWLAKGWPVGELFTATQKPVVLPRDFITHEGTWIQALERLIELEPESFEPDMDERGFWKHELKAMRNAYQELKAIEAAGGIVKDGE